MILYTRNYFKKMRMVTKITKKTKMTKIAKMIKRKMITKIAKMTKPLNVNKDKFCRSYNGCLIIAFVIKLLPIKSFNKRKNLDKKLYNPIKNKG